jgi:hypothetical protein
MPAQGHQYDAGGLDGGAGGQDGQDGEAEVGVEAVLEEAGAVASSSFS